MRLFESLLLFANLLSLFLAFKQRPRAVWLGMAGANLALLALHAALEGMRWQMAFAYLFTALFAVWALVKSAPRFRRIALPGAIRVIAGLLALVGLGLSAFLAYALPVFTLPAPTGSDAVGIQYLHLVDETRAEPFLAHANRKRELMVKVYYPAQPDASKPFAPYFHGSPQLLRLLSAGYQMPGFLFDQLNLVQTRSKDGLALSDRQARYPVILFSHGAGTSMETLTAQCEDLASRGYIVVAIDHTYVSAATVFPDRIVSAKEATTSFDVAEPAAPITQIMADDASFVIDQLAAIDAGSGADSGADHAPSIFAGRLDLAHIGAIGHSVGGAVAYNLAVNEPRIKAAINLDGAVYVAPKAGAAVAPFLMLANDKFHVQAIRAREPLIPSFDAMPEMDQHITLSIYGSRAAYDAAYTTARQNVIALASTLQATGGLYTITGSDHMKFTDIGLYIGFRPLRERIGIGGSTDPARCLEITEAVTRAFFDWHLKGVAGDTLETLPRKYPELEPVGLR